MDKRQRLQIKLAIAMIVICLAILGALLYSAMSAENNPKPGQLNIPIGNMLIESAKNGVIIAWAIFKLVFGVFWKLITGSWISVFITIALIALLVIKFKMERNDSEDTTKEQ